MVNFQFNLILRYIVDGNAMLIYYDALIKAIVLIP